MAIHVTAYIGYAGTERRLADTADTPLEAARAGWALLRRLKKGEGEPACAGAFPKGLVIFSHQPYPLPAGVSYADGESAVKIILSEWAFAALLRNEGVYDVQSAATAIDSQENLEAATARAAKIRRRAEDVVRKMDPVAAIAVGLYVSVVQEPLARPEILREIW